MRGTKRTSPVRALVCAFALLVATVAGCDDDVDDEPLADGPDACGFDSGIAGAGGTGMDAGPDGSGGSGGSGGLGGGCGSGSETCCDSGTDDDAGN